MPTTLDTPQTLRQRFGAPVFTGDTERGLVFTGAPERHEFAGIQPYWSQAQQNRAADTLSDLVALLAHKPEDCRVFVRALGDPSTPASEEADVEDFWENAARGSAALQAAIKHQVSLFQSNDPRALKGLATAQRLGPVMTVEERRHAQDPYLGHPLFELHAGRFTQQVTLYDDEMLDELDEFPEDDMVSALVRMAEQGITQAVVKYARRKAGLFTLVLSNDYETMQRRVFAADDGWNMTRLAGEQGAFLIQERVPMTYEYRFFVVDGQIVSGAGCIEEFTPFDALSTDAAFDPRMRRNRPMSFLGNNSSAADPIEHQDELLARYHEWLTEVLARIDSTETCVIDLAVRDDTDDVLIVELNTLPNAGLYASNPWLVYDHLAAAQDTGYSGYVFGDNAALLDTAPLF